MKRKQGTDPYTYGCQGQGARNLGYTDVYDEANIYNRTTFKRWLHYFVTLTCGTKCSCAKQNMGAIYKTMMLTSNGAIVYDGLVRLEDFYPSLYKSLHKFECHMPGTIDWKRLSELRKQVEKRGHAGNFNLVDIAD